MIISGVDFLPFGSLPTIKPCIRTTGWYLILSMAVTYPVTNIIVLLNFRYWPGNYFPTELQALG